MNRRQKTWPGDFCRFFASCSIFFNYLFIYKFSDSSRVFFKCNMTIFEKKYFFDFTPEVEKL